MGKPKKQDQILAKHFGQRLVGGRLSEMATYADLFEKMTDCIFLLSLDTFDILECNSSVSQTLGIPTEDVLGESLFRWIEPEDQARAKQHLNEANSGKENQMPFDVRLLGSGGTLLTYELVACRLKLADYCEVLQVIAKNVNEARAYQHYLKTLSSTDSMTGIANFRAFETELDLEHERAVRYDTPYSILFFDVDHFKNYNDQNGHPAGDAVLKKVAQILGQNSRRSDLVARYGGEEFVVLGRGVDKERALQYAEKLRKSIENEPFLHGEKQPLGRVTVSVGVATYPMAGKDLADVLKSADHALYESKKSGRNRVSSASPESTSTKS